MLNVPAAPCLMPCCKKTHQSIEYISYDRGKDYPLRTSHKTGPIIQFTPHDILFILSFHKRKIYEAQLQTKPYVAPAAFCDIDLAHDCPPWKYQAAQFTGQ